MDASRRRAARVGSGGLDLFSIAGIRITIDYSWFVIFLLVAFSLARSFTQLLPEGTTLAVIVAYSAVATILLFASLLAHELSHSLVALAKGIPVPRITLFIFGGVSQLGREPDRPADEIQIALAGPAVSFAIGLFCFAGVVISPAGSGLWALFLVLGVINVMLAIFNLVPAFPLDGGRVLRALIWHWKGSLARATVAAARAGRALALALMVMGVLRVFLAQDLLGLWWIFIGLFLSRAAGASAERAVIREALSGTPVERIMTTPVVTLAGDESLATAVETAFLAHHHVAYPVVEHGAVIGMLNLKDIRKVPREMWPTCSVREAMTPLSGTGFARPEDDVVEVLDRMLSSGVGRLPVVRKGQLAGILTRRDIMNFLRVQTDLGE